MAEKTRKVKIDALVEGHGGELVFRPVKTKKQNIKLAAEASKNPVIKNNIYKAGTGKKMRL